MAEIPKNLRSDRDIEQAISDKPGFQLIDTVPLRAGYLGSGPVADERDFPTGTCEFFDGPEKESTLS